MEKGCHVQKKKKIKEFKAAPRRGSFGEHHLYAYKSRETGLHLPCILSDLTRTATECPFLSQNLEDLPSREGVPMGKYGRLGGVVVEADMPCWLGGFGGLNHAFPTYPRRRPTLC
jgi:hypothetical protein